MISILMLSAISLHRRDKSDAEPLDSLVGLKLVNVCESKKIGQFRDADFAAQSVAG